MRSDAVTWHIFLTIAPHAAAYLIGPVRAPIGDVLLSFGWSLEMGGLYCLFDQIHVRTEVRGRGIATEVISKMTEMLRSTGIKTVYVQATQEYTNSKRLFKRAHFRSARTYTLMLRDL